MCGPDFPKHTTPLDLFQLSKSHDLGNHRAEHHPTVTSPGCVGYQLQGGALVWNRW